MRGVPAPDLGHRRHGDARLEAQAGGLVPGVSDGHPLERQFGPATDEATRARLAWLLTHKLRRAMVAPARTPLSGLVEVDETAIAFRGKDDPPAGGGGRSHQGKLLVAGVVEIGDSKLRHLRLAAIDDISAVSMHRFLDTSLAAGNRAKTDGWSSYPGVPDLVHQPHVIGGMAANIVLPWIHRAFSNLKTWALGVYHGLRRKHLQACLDEFFFRFNRRRTRHAAFRILLGIGLVTRPVTYEMLISLEATA